MNPLPTSELQAMSRLAWRNSSRCIGRYYWKTLRLVDARDCFKPGDIFEACVEHLRQSTNRGKIVPLITVFPEAESPRREIRIWNPQLIRYAGYRVNSGKVLGDPGNLELTSRLISLGWEPPTCPSAFDLLPLAIDVPDEDVKWFELPREAVMEVPLRHPEFSWWESLGLKWHALPAISDMALSGAGHLFTAAPFSGFYMGTEIGCRNLADQNRYNLLPLIASKMGLDTGSRTQLWKDRALVELNTAVLFSFQEAGVSMVDHHTASDHFMKFCASEENAGRPVRGDWSWLVPPMSGSTSPVFHRYYKAGDAEQEPNFVYQEKGWNRRNMIKLKSSGTCPFQKS